jgi:CubicO group peptidase (beta-lactamase class C family)
MWNKVVWYCENLSAVAIAFISFLVMNSQIPTESAPSRSKVLLEEIRVALERTRSSFVSKGLLAVLVVLSGFYLQEASAAEQAKPDPAIEKRIQELIPSLEGYIATGMKAFDVPGLAIGIVAGDKLIYAKGFGGRRKGGGELVDARTVFQIGSTTKAFLAASMAITVDHGKVHWDDRVIDLDPDFELKDAWVTREFRVFDLLAQRAGLPPYANDALGMFGLDEVTLIRSLRDVEPVSSFRSTFAYTNITHLLAGRILAKLEGVPD